MQSVHGKQNVNQVLQRGVKKIPLHAFCPKWQGWNICCIVLSPIRAAPVVQVTSNEPASQPNRVRIVHDTMAPELHAQTHIQLNTGKARVWNSAGLTPPSLEPLMRI